MKLLRWLTERPLSQAEANAKLRALMAKRLRNHPEQALRVRWDKATEKVRA